MYRLTKNSNIPSFLKILIYIVLTITCVYWLGIMIYRILDLVRFCLHWATDKGHWWLTVTITLIAVITCLLMAQFWWGLNPFGKTITQIVETFNTFRKWLGTLIIGV